MNGRSGVWLVDSGPLVAYLDRNDPEHVAVASCLDAFAGRLVTTGAVIAEAVYFVSGMRRGPPLLARLVEASGMRVYDLCQPRELSSAVALMGRYAHVPMDLPDATLLLLAEGLEADEILTLDREGFGTYRTRGGRRLHLVLDAGA